MRILGGFWGVSGDLGSLKEDLEATLGGLGGTSGYFGAILGGLGGSWADLGVILGWFWGVILGWSWAILGMFWEEFWRVFVRILGGSRGILGGSWRDREKSWGVLRDLGGSRKS